MVGGKIVPTKNPVPFPVIVSSWREELLTHTTSDEACGRCYMEWGTTPKNDATIAGHESHSRIKGKYHPSQTSSPKQNVIPIWMSWCFDRQNKTRKKEITRPKNMTTKCATSFCCCPFCCFLLRFLFLLFPFLFYISFRKLRCWMSSMRLDAARSPPMKSLWAERGLESRFCQRGVRLKKWRKEKWMILYFWFFTRKTQTTHILNNQFKELPRFSTN